MKQIMRLALVCLLSISSSAFAGGDNHKDCKNCKQKTCTSACMKHCSKKDSCKQKQAACTGTMPCAKSSCKQNS